MNLQFGSGSLLCRPNGGNLAVNPTPQALGVLQEVSVEFKGDLKKLFGQKQFAVATARGKIDVTGKGTFASQDANALNQLYFGQTATTGANRIITDERHTPSTSVTLNLPGTGTFVKDYGVVSYPSGQQMTFVASGTPTVGQYTISSGNYVFAAGETATSVGITYMETSATGVSILLNNQFMGYAPQFEAFLFNSFRGKYFGLQLNACTMGMISIPTKQEDFWIQSFDFSANCDASDSLGAIYADTF